VLTSQGSTVADAIRSIGVTEVTYYRGRQEFGGLKASQVKRLKELETENQRLRKAVADLTLNQRVAGSSPVTPTNLFKDLAAVQVRGAKARAEWRFANRSGF
jgi:putative transposase